MTPDCETDVMFVVDRSSSMTDYYDKVLGFLKESVERILDLSGSKVRVGIIVFYSEASLEVGGNGLHCLMFIRTYTHAHTHTAHTHAHTHTRTHARTHSN